MTITTIMDEETITQITNPGIELAALRLQKGYSLEYVANKLHLRVKIIELIESGDFNALPQPVFVNGYLRAYSKLLGVPAEPYLEVFKTQYPQEKKSDRAALWQSKKESHKVEHIIRWFTILFALGVMIAVGLWWQSNRDAQPITSNSQAENDRSLNESSSEIRLTDLSKMQSLFLPTKPDMTPLEKQSG